ncbi:MAG: DEAD/DEAH box helicase [Candidatus Omnitrophica bacterium]|nr:DEAD/DEAH box helicase [Candidatus Omnitrophota bacterium]
MDSLSLRFNNEVFLPYIELLKAQYRIHPDFAHAKRIWESKLIPSELVNGPYLEKSQIYAEGKSLENLELHKKTVKTINERLGGRSLWKHQTDALEQLLENKNCVIATGTSSGKTLCYQIPILNDLICDSSDGLRAIIIYPLNALVNDQLEEWEKLLKGYDDIRFARFTGQTPKTQFEYDNRLREIFREQAKIGNPEYTQQELAKDVEQRLVSQLKNEIPNKLNHREIIRQKPPQILVTNFSMLEYLLERPVDAPIFENARLKYLVLDEAHAYRGVQATEIAFLIRRLKDRLNLEKLTCIATSATLGKAEISESKEKVRKFASALFNDEFLEPNPIYGTPAKPEYNNPTFSPKPDQYMKAVQTLRNDSKNDIRSDLGAKLENNLLATLLNHDSNLFRLRNDILNNKPKLLKEVAGELWPKNKHAEEGLQALMEIVSFAKSDDSHEDLLPTRLHYFVKAQDGLHVCLHSNCPAREDGKPAFYVSRKNSQNIPEGDCPHCHEIGQKSKLVEVVTCRKCGYLYGTLQDLGPRRCQNQDDDTVKPYFDSFDTELGWAADSFWTYFCVDQDLPFPNRNDPDDEIEQDNDKCIDELSWCVICGKKKDEGAGDNCKCTTPHIRKIKIIHRQCPHSGKANDRENLYRQEKKQLSSCPNCGARNGSGLEPVRRFQESDDQTGLAMAVPFSHFEVSSVKNKDKIPRKLLCFTDHRQRAAAFPSLIEEETFTHDLGRKITKIIEEEKEIGLVELGDRLADIVDSQSDSYDPDFFLPVSRYPDEELDSKGTRNLWVAEVFGYFGVPDSARESAEDLGLVKVKYQIKDEEIKKLHGSLTELNLSVDELHDLIQNLLGYVRQRKAFTLPKGRVEADSPAFGRVFADIYFVKKREKVRVTYGWLPAIKKDNFVTSYIRQIFSFTHEEALKVAEKIWDFITSEFILYSKNQKTWKLDYEKIYVMKADKRYVCDRCNAVSAYSVKECCPRIACSGKLKSKDFIPTDENIISKWVSGKGLPQFSSLRSEEHTAQINKDLAKKIEDEFRLGRKKVIQSGAQIDNDIKIEGINLLSSTTTFEMGINIGDLQKVLLRNAPPTSANYVQRVGRAGRGQDKNSVCVTLCRRTKYDADAWNNPLLLMSGEVRTPTVFTQNIVIAQRHFNASIFSKFLRQKLISENQLNKESQQIRLEAFINLEAKNKIPNAWFQNNSKTIFLDFIQWANERAKNEVFQTNSGLSILDGIEDFDMAKNESLKKYEFILGNIIQELIELMEERDKLYHDGIPTSDIEYSIKNLLGSDVISVLAKRGFLPRYAFPLDVVTLETGKTRWTREVDVELSRERGVAIAEFAPSAQVIAHKKVFTSSGLYIVSQKDKPDIKWYSECPQCKQIRTSLTKDVLLKNCSVCDKLITNQYINPFIEPESFSVRLDNGVAGQKYRRSTLIRQRQTLTHFIDNVDNSSFKDKDLFNIALKEAGSLFRYNLGPERKGFYMCYDCGCCEPVRNVKLDKPHKKLRVFTGSALCNNDKFFRPPLAFGHQFQSFCLIIRPAQPTTHIESLAYALQRGLCAMLDIEIYDIGVSWRWLSNKNESTNAEIVLYDHTPGGAGFVKEAKENWDELINSAKHICSTCVCEHACYDCLKNYSNQFYHELLDRNSVIGYFQGSQIVSQKNGGQRPVF